MSYGKIVKASLLSAIVLATLGYGKLETEAAQNQQATENFDILAPVYNNLPDLQKAKAAVDISKGWDGTDFEADLADFGDIFHEDHLGANNVRSAYTSFANIGYGHMNAVKKIQVKAHRKYTIHLKYQLFAANDSVAYVDFNGKRIETTEGNSTGLKDYVEEYTPDADGFYIIKQGFVSNPNDQITTLVGCDETAGTGGGFIEEDAPLAPTLEDSEHGSRSIIGKGTPGNTAVAQLNDGTILGEVRINSTGTFEISTSRPIVLSDNGKITVFQKTDSGVEGDSAALTIIDTVAPETPIVKDVEAFQKNIEGTAEAGTIMTFANSQGDEIPTDGTVIVKSDGSFKATLTRTVNWSDVRISAISTDEGGNSSVAGEGIIVDTINPIVNNVNDIQDDSTDITGQLAKEEDALDVFVKIGDQLEEATVDQDTGNFTFNLSHKLAAGTVVEIYAQDTAGNKSDIITKTVISMAPLEPPVLDKVTDRSTSVTGKTTYPEARIDLIVDGDNYSGYSDATGYFKINLNGFYAEGKQIIATVSFNGKESPEATMTITDGTPPTFTAVDSLLDNNDKLSGETEVNAVIDVLVYEDENKPDQYRALAGADGKFSVDFYRSYAAGTKVEVFATDAKGNKSEAYGLKVKNHLAVVADFDTVTSYTKEFKGNTLRPYVTYTLTIGSKVYTGTSDGNGDILIPITGNFPLGTEVKLDVLDKNDEDTTTNAASKPDKIRPRSATIASANVGSKDITINGDIGAEVTVVIERNGSEVQTITETLAADSNGKITLQATDDLEEGDVLKVSQKMETYVSDVVTFTLQVIR